MPKAQQLLDGTLSGYPPPTLSLMKEVFAKGWLLISSRYQTVEAAVAVAADLSRPVLQARRTTRRFPEPLAWQPGRLVCWQVGEFPRLVVASRQDYCAAQDHCQA
jgi:hypothetical protein